jgi:hypothetical protein
VKDRTFRIVFTASALGILVFGSLFAAVFYFGFYQPNFLSCRAIRLDAELNAIARAKIVEMADMAERGKISLNAPFYDGMTPLMMYADNGQRAGLKWLLKKEVDLNLQCDRGWTALMYAVQRKDPVAIQALLDRHPDLELKTNDGLTVFLLAASLGRNEILDQLAAAGADVHALDAEGRNAYQRIMGLPHLHKETIQVLHQLGVDTSEQTKLNQIKAQKLQQLQSQQPAFFKPSAEGKPRT